MKTENLLWILAGGGLLVWLISKNQAQEKAVSPVEIDALKSNVSQGLSANEEVGLFDRLFGVRAAATEMVKLKNTLQPAFQTIRICHSDGTCEVQSRSVLGAEGLHPIRAPRYFLNYLGLTF